jgi:hypothetical protein
MSRCRCTATCLADGTCPFGCPPKWKRRPGLRNHEGKQEKREDMLNAATVRAAFNASVPDAKTEFFNRKRGLNKGV